jgi:hypothetical protein
MAPIDPRDFGRLEVEVMTLQKQMTEIAKDMSAIRSLLDQTKGGWRVIVAVAGITSAITVLAIKLLPFWPFK